MISLRQSNTKKVPWQLVSNVKKESEVS